MSLVDMTDGSGVMPIVSSDIPSRLHLANHQLYHNLASWLSSKRRSILHDRVASLHSVFSQTNSGNRDQ